MKVNSKRKKFYLIAFIFLSLFICVESCLPSGISSFQSQLIAIIFNKGKKEDKEILPNSLTIEGNDIMQIGEKQQLKVNFSPKNVSDTRVKWSMIEPSDAGSLTESGWITALKEGNMRVRATSNVNSNIFADFSIQIEPVILKELKLEIVYPTETINNDEIEISVGITAGLSFQCIPNNATYSDVQWVSTNPSVAMVNERGVVKGISEGNCEIYIESIKYPTIKSNSIKMKVNSNPIGLVTSIDTNDVEPIFVSQSIEIDPIFNEDATDKSYYVISSDPSIIRVSGKQIIGEKEGSASITFISNADENIKSRKIQVEVKEVNAVEIRVLSDTYVYQKPIQLHYALISENSSYYVTNKEVSFSIEKNDFCTIDEKGIMYAKKTGKIAVSIFWNKDKTISTTKIIQFVIPNNSLWGRINYLTRKIIGHFSLFLVTGIFGMLTIIAYKKDIRYLYAILINLGYGFLLGTVSELLQLIPVGRACQFKDIIIDTIGYVIGALMILFVIYLIDKGNKKKERQKEIDQKDVEIKNK